MEEKAQNKPQTKKKPVSNQIKRRKKTPKHLFKLFINVQGDFTKIDFDIFRDTPDLKTKLLNIALDKILDSVGTKKVHIEVCEINDTGGIVCIHKSEWANLLEIVKQNYIKEERYEDCQYIQKLIESL